MPEHPWKDEYTLLCEKCGYVIEGLDTDSNCPECGKPIAESLPERRVGTPWQQSPSVGSLVKTWWMTLRHPLRTLDVMRVGIAADDYQGMLSRYGAIGSVAIACSAFTSGDFIRTAVYFAMIWILSCAGHGALYVLFRLLSKIESRGLMLFSRQRGTRITRDFAWAIVLHGSVGWVVVWVSLVICTFMILSSGLLGTATFHNYRPDSEWMRIVGLSIAVVGSLSGFLFFETFAYLGLRRLKYANRVRPDAPQQGATTRVEDAQ